MLELDSREDQLGAEDKQVLLNSKTKAWVDEQNKMSTEKDTPQPTRALQEFVKHIADPLVNKGWNLHLKFGKGESQGEKFVKGSSPQEPTTKTDKKEKS